MIVVGKDFADLTIAVHEALQDGRVCQFEKSTIRREISHIRESLDVMDESVKVA